MNKAYSLLILLSSCLFFVACEEETASPREDWGYDYFPLNIGQEWHYGMDSIIVKLDISGIVFDSVRLEVKEVLVDTFRDLENELWYRGERYDRRSDTLDWRFSQTFALHRDQQKALRLEDNLEFTKMTFPVEQYRSWNGNLNIDENRFFPVAGAEVQIYRNWNQLYRYESIAATDMIADHLYEQVAVVEAADYDDNLLFRRYALEKYVPQKGLVYREMQVFDSQCQICCAGNTVMCIDLPWRTKAEAGYIIRQWLVE